MQLMAAESEGLAWSPKSAADEHHVLSQLEQMLISEHFRRSKRSALLLRHLVVETLRGRDGALKERTLGIEVFGRRPDYDTSADPIVRMAAGEIRKRIAQYYHDQGHESELRIDLEPGSYVVHFHRHRPESGPRESGPTESVHEQASFAVASAPIPIPTVAAVTDTAVTEPFSRSERPSGRLRLFLALGALLILGVLGWFFHSRPKSYVTQAWGSMLDGRSPILIAIGEPRLYLHVETPASPKLMTTSEHLQTGQVISYSEVQALVRLVGIVDRRKTLHLQNAGSTSFADLREGPVVLLGGLNNPWTMRAQSTLPFRLATDGNGFNWIVDVHNPADKKWFVDSHLPYSSLTTDYAIVARFYDTSTQQQTLIVAGLGENGTKAAGELITEEEQIKKLLGDSLLKAQNFEVLLETQVIDGTSGPPKLLAKEVW